MNNNILNDNVKNFLDVSEEELAAEKDIYGNLFMNVRKKLVNETLKHAELENKFLDRFYLREAGIPEKKTDTSPEPIIKSNKDMVHQRYGHFLDKYL